MEPLTTAIIAAVTSGLSNTTHTAISDAYIGLKQKLTALFSEKDNKFTDAINAVEANPESVESQTSLNDKLSDINVAQHQELMLSLTQLFNQLEQNASGKEALQKYAVNAEKVGVVGDNVSINSQSF